MKELIEKYKEKILTNKRSLIKAERGVSVQILTGEISAYQDIVKDLESLQSNGKNKEEVSDKKKLVANWYAKLSLVDHGLQSLLQDIPRNLRERKGDYKDFETFAMNISAMKKRLNDAISDVSGIMEEYAQSHAKPTHSGKTKEQVWEEVQSYHQIEGTIPEGSRVGAAVYDAMERFANQEVPIYMLDHPNSKT